MDARSFKNRAVVLVIIALAVLMGMGLGRQEATALSQALATNGSLPQAEVLATTNTVSEQGAAFALEAQLISVYKASSPSVVTITTRTSVRSRFMGAVPQEREGTGSGFVYDRAGHIVTNFHVVEGAQRLMVTFTSGKTYEATVVGTDPANDLAVIHVDAGTDLPAPLPLADSDLLEVGQFVIAIGNPFGLGQALTTGVVSAVGRVIESPQDNRFIGQAIQTDAAINPGNSGGPMLDLNGRVVGVNSQIISPSGASVGVGFAVPSNTVQRVVPELIAKGSYAHPWLGLQLLSLTPDSAQMLRNAGMTLPVDQGLLVAEVVAGSPAATAGVKGATRFVREGSTRIPIDGDVLTAINGQPLHGFADLTVYL
ncbi:MAG: trypsin-like serine protease, partial [Chloroflexi bacterium]|nr:trypsin-like serine protease [Chloroflexota bacterium]